MNAPRLNISDEVLDQVLRALSRGNKIEAVKLLRGAAGLSLAEAKQLADQLEAEQSNSAQPPESTGQDWRTTAKQLLLAGKKLQAIKICREQTGSSLQLAKEKVEELATQEGIPDQQMGCLPVLVIAVVLAVAIGIGIAWALR